LTQDVRGDTFKNLIKVRQRSVGVRCDYTVPLIISLTPRLLRVTLQERLQSEFCPHYRNSCTQPQHFPRCGNTSPKKKLYWSFLGFVFAKNMKSGVPATLGRVVKAEFESHPEISCATIWHFARLKHVRLSMRFKFTFQFFFVTKAEKYSFGGKKHLCAKR